MEKCNFSSSAATFYLFFFCIGNIHISGMCDVGIYFYFNFSNYDLLIAFGPNTDVSKRKEVAVTLEIRGLRASFIDL